MALIPTLTLKDSTTFSDEVNFSVTDSLTVTAPAQNTSVIIADGTGANAIIKAASSAVTYVYIRHTGTTDGTTGTSQLLALENTDNSQFGSLKAGEWCFIPHLSGSLGIQLQSASGNIQVEYAKWTAS